MVSYIRRRLARSDVAKLEKGFWAGAGNKVKIPGKCVRKKSKERVGKFEKINYKTKKKS